ncbi:hypothetical protein JYU34_008449 [Plutella xylostella]|uniref:Uncharacterized protein n=1 Tax=Plutella xylostella TaxID=51655 RepID=A0ABQ7QLX3_PLUXY|nr:hypothetical protein JYU34_008449 [Plutella xylostella]
MSYKNCCLTCLSTSKETRNIHTAISISGDDIRLSDILLNFYNFKIPDDGEPYPENICISCVHQLTITYSFKILIDSSFKTLSENLCQAESDNDYNEYFYESEDEPIKLPPKSSFTAKKVHRRKSVKMELVKEEPKPLFCVECKSQYFSVQALNEHCMNNHPVRSTVGRDCEYCSEKFDDFRSLARHRKLHLKPYLCENCWEGFFTTDDLSTHSCLRKDKSSELEKPDRALRQCDQCGKSYPPGYIKNHMLTHSDDRPFHCKLCPKKFKVSGGLHSHILWNHKRTRNHKCEICNATFISSSSRSSHIRKNHLKEKKYACKCGKRFFSKSELERHMLTHTGVKNFHCHLCDKSYQTRYGLNVHLKSHSQMSSQMNLNVLSL